MLSAVKIERCRFSILRPMMSSARSLLGNTRGILTGAPDINSPDARFAVASLSGAIQTLTFD
jgi:hypothetical protein